MTDGNIPSAGEAEKEEVGVIRFMNDRVRFNLCSTMVPDGFTPLDFERLPLQSCCDQMRCPSGTMVCGVWQTQIDKLMDGNFTVYILNRFL